MAVGALCAGGLALLAALGWRGSSGARSPVATRFRDTWLAVGETLGMSVNHAAHTHALTASLEGFLDGRQVAVAVHQPWPRRVGEPGFGVGVVRVAVALHQPLPAGFRLLLPGQPPAGLSPGARHIQPRRLDLDPIYHVSAIDDAGAISLTADPRVRDGLAVFRRIRGAGGVEGARVQLRRDVAGIDGAPQPMLDTAEAVALLTQLTGAGGAFAAVLDDAAAWPRLTERWGLAGGTAPGGEGVQGTIAGLAVTVRFAAGRGRPETRVQVGVPGVPDALCLVHRDARAPVGAAVALHHPILGRVLQAAARDAPEAAAILSGTALGDVLLPLFGAFPSARLAAGLLEVRLEGRRAGRELESLVETMVDAAQGLRVAWSPPD